MQNAIERGQNEQPLHVVAAVAVVIKGDKFLAGRRDRNDKSFPGLYALPGGKVENGETIEEALRQEVREEAGVEIKNIQYVTEFSRTEGDEAPEYSVLGLIFAADYKSAKIRPGDDMETIEWMTLEQAKKLDFIPGTLKDVEKAFKIHDF